MEDDPVLETSYQRQDAASTVPARISLQRLERDRRGRRIGLAVLAVFVALGVSNSLGVSQATVRAQGAGYQLDVTYPRVGRPGLPVAWEISVRHPGGFAEPVRVAVSHDYLDLFDANMMTPEPSSTTVDDDLLVMEFDPPTGDVLHVSVDARMEPRMHLPHEAVTEVVGTGVQVRYRTWVLP